MRWPWIGNSDEAVSNSEIHKRSESPISTVSLTDWRAYLSPQVVLPTVVSTATVLTGRRLYKLYIRRIPAASRITSAFWRKRSLFGTVTSVGDGDGFRLFHTPGGRLTGWGWVPGRTVPSGKALKDQTISVRIAGVDAPEAAHFGKLAQPGAKEALEWLTSYIGSRRVRAYVYKRDQFDRAVATVYVRKGLLRRDVGLQMLRNGLATVYEAKTGAEFGHLEQNYRAAEERARARKRGIWGMKKANFESPRDYKTRTAHEQAGKDS